jgi:hypothetical protein
MKVVTLTTMPEAATSRLGSKQKWRGPSRSAGSTRDGELGIKPPLFASKRYYPLAEPR